MGWVTGESRERDFQVETAIERGRLNSIENKRGDSFFTGLEEREGKSQAKTSHVGVSGQPS